MLAQGGEAPGQKAGDGHDGAGYEEGEDHPQGRGPDGLKDAARGDAPKAEEDDGIETVENSDGEASESHGSSKGRRRRSDSHGPNVNCVSPPQM